ncbi:hypothetical protein Tco_0417300 [Tanacetum coccineum]
MARHYKVKSGSDIEERLEKSKIHDFFEESSYGGKTHSIVGKKFLDTQLGLGHGTRCTAVTILEYRSLPSQKSREQELLRIQPSKFFGMKGIANMELYKSWGSSRVLSDIFLQRSMGVKNRVLAGYGIMAGRVEKETDISAKERRKNQSKERQNRTGWKSVLEDEAKSKFSAKKIHPTPYSYPPAFIKSIWQSHVHSPKHFDGEIAPKEAQMKFDGWVFV